MKTRFRSSFVIVFLLLATALLIGQEAQVQPVTQPEAASSAPMMMTGPWGRLAIVGISGKYAVYLNGRGPAFYVGTVREVDRRQLILSPGLQHVILVDPKTDNEVYSGYVQVKANKKAVLHVDLSDTAYADWPEGAQLQSLPRYSASSETTGAIAPVSARFAIDGGNTVDCGQPARLVWTTAETGKNLLKVNNVALGGGPVANSGEMLVYPTQDTTYVFETFGPGGIYETSETLHINKEVQASLSADPGVVRYHRVGTNVVEPGDIVLNWTAHNADKITIDGVGPVSGTAGTQTVKFTPSLNGYGPVAETRTYTITASNPCGNVVTRTASVQVGGSIDPEVVAEAQPIEPLPPKLPTTGSPLPLIGLLGISSLASGLVLRGIRRKK